MIKNAKNWDNKRSDNLKKYREEDKIEESNSANFDKHFVHKQLLKTIKDATVEARIKSKLNYIQRSSSYMDSHFSKRN
ncbi:hypothetical protein NQ314_009643 [Rhamnusium bicolor]|uniref:Uncharacterized protein n=1 Tax=Rhamnusium bicolor TaxID=1586634 RepID=A0AAV8XXH2_9CUCU|nr:hypothetical protein NQ314_009643 [Rhamnusium bicolor]